MRSSSETRRAARTALSGNWGSAVLVTLIVVAISSAVSFLLSFFSLAADIVSGVGAGVFLSDSVYDAGISAPAMVGISGIGILFGILYIAIMLCTYFVSSNLQAGQAIYYLNLVSGNHSDVSDLFAQFKRGFMKPFGIFWLTYLKMMLWMLIGYLPGCVLIALASVAFLYELPAVGGLCVFFGILLVILGLVLMIIAALRYSMVYYVLADNPTIRVRDAVRISKELMRGHKADYFILNLSFIGWAFLSIFTCGIGSLFLDPYMSASSAVFYCDLIGRPVVGDMAWFEAMRQNGTYIPGSYTPYGSGQNGYNQNGYNQNVGAQNGYAPGGYSGNPQAQEAPEAPCADTAPEASAPLSENTEIPMQEEAPIQNEVKFDEVDISKIGEQENTSDNAENAENGDNPSQNN